MVETITLQGGNAPLSADLYVPEDPEGAPLIVAASGGGWRRGGRADLAQWGDFFAAHGIAVASVDYRRSADGPAFPGNLEDVAAAANLIVDHGRDRGLDTSRMAFLGASAGAHLVTLAHLSDHVETPPIRGFAGIYGPYDMMRLWQQDLATAPSPADNHPGRMLGCGPFDNPDLYHRASPMRQITSARKVPAFLSWGLLDPAIDPAQSADFALALQQAGFPVRRRVFTDAGHFWFTEDDLHDPATHAARVSWDLLRFFRRILDTPRT